MTTLNTWTKGKLRSWWQLLSSAAYCCKNTSWNTVSFLRFFPSLTRARARTLQQFCTFCFHNLHRNPCKALKDYTLRGIFRSSITLFQKNRRKAVEKCSKSEKKNLESFPKRVRPTQKKHTRNMEKAPTFFGKTPTFFKKSPTFSLERWRYYPNLKAWLREARCEGCESKKCKIPGKARASHAREEKSLWRGAKWNESDLPFHRT